MMTYDYWLNSILNSVRNISSRDFQERAWLGKGPEVSSPAEIYNTLFDDFTFDLFFETYSQKLTESQVAAWNNLKSHLEEYGDKMPDNPDPRKVLDDPEWQRVREAAAQFVRAFEEKRPEAPLASHT